VAGGQLRFCNHDTTCCGSALSTKPRSPMAAARARYLIIRPDASFLVIARIQSRPARWTLSAMSPAQYVPVFGPTAFIARSAQAAHGSDPLSSVPCEVSWANNPRENSPSRPILPGTPWTRVNRERPDHIYRRQDVDVPTYVSLTSPSCCSEGVPAAACCLAGRRGQASPRGGASGPGTRLLGTR